MKELELNMSVVLSNAIDNGIANYNETSGKEPIEYFQCENIRIEIMKELKKILDI